MRRILLTIWIWLKHKIGVWRGWIGDLNTELKYVKDYIDDPTWEELRANGMEYQKDFIDSQYDSITAVLRKSDDCDGFNRIAQVYWHNQGYKAYLVSYMAKPFKKSHTTCILKADGIWINCDYGYYGIGFYNLENCIDHIAKKHKSTVKAWVAQDINWSIKWRMV